MLLIALATTILQDTAQTYPADVINQSDYVGYWSNSPAWSAQSSKL
jgi:hypothetical protein